MITDAEKIEPALAAMLFMATLTGARRGELCALRWTDLDEDAGTLTIARSVYETSGGSWAEKTTKSRQVRTIGLDDLSLDVLRRVHQATRALAASLDFDPLADGFIFSRSPVGADPVRPDVLIRFATRVAAKAGVETHLHALRHFSATQAIASGFDPVTVGGCLGRADPSITLRVYSHALEQRVDVAVIPQPNVHGIPHRAPVFVLVDGGSFRPPTGGQQSVELGRQVVGRRSAELGGNDHALLTAA